MRRNGFTLLEILIIVAIMAVLVGVTVATFVSFRNAQTLDRDTDAIVSALREARSQTLVSQNASVYGVHLASSTVTLFTGSSYSAGTASNVVTNLTSTNIISTLTLTGNGTDIVFKRLTGETDQDGTLVLKSSATNNARTVTVYKTGLIEFK